VCSVIQKCLHLVPSEQVCDLHFNPINFWDDWQEYTRLLWSRSPRGQLPTGVCLLQIFQNHITSTIIDVCYFNTSTWRPHRSRLSCVTFPSCSHHTARSRDTISMRSFVTPSTKVESRSSYSIHVFVREQHTSPGYSNRYSLHRLCSQVMHHDNWAVRNRREPSRCVVDLLSFIFK
jgi:hypothetical protein